MKIFCSLHLLLVGSLLVSLVEGQPVYNTSTPTNDVCTVADPSADPFPVLTAECEAQFQCLQELTGTCFEIFLDADGFD